MVVTRLKEYENEYKEWLKRNKEMINNYKGKGVALNDNSILEERCNILYEIYKAKERYVKMYHGEKYKKLEKEYIEAKKDLNSIREDEDEYKIERIIENYKRREREVYVCLKNV